MKTHALSVFRLAPERLNCAQSVLAGYQAITGDHTLPLSALKPCGGGRAPDGLCGALHAACIAAPAHTESLKADFRARIGALRCQDIESPCTDCVGTASELLQNSLSPPSSQPAPDATPTP